MKKIATGALVLVLSWSANAMEGKGFTIVSESFQTTGNAITGSVKHVDNFLSAPKYAIASAGTTNASGGVNQNIGIHGWHHVSINNNTQNKQRYKIRYSLNAADGGSVHNVEVDVEKGGFFSDYADTYLVVNERYRDRWTIYARTEVKGETNAEGQGTATLDVR